MSRFSNYQKETYFCTNCGFNTGNQMTYCPECSSFWEKESLISARGMVKWGIFLLVSSGILSFILLLYSLQVGLTETFEKKLTPIFLMLIWVLFVKGCFDFIVGNHIRETGDYGKTKNYLLLYGQIAICLLPMAVYYLFLK